MASCSFDTKRKREEYVEDGEEQEEQEDDDEWYEENTGYMDDESEPHKFGNSVLPVANLPESFDGVPEDGMQYLFTVRREEKLLPLVTRVPNPYIMQEVQVQPVAIDDVGGTSREKLPSQEWRTCFEERFRNLRANRRQPTINVSLPRPSAPKVSELPAMRDRDRWWAFFRGDTKWQDIPCSQFHGKSSDRRQRQGKAVMEYEEDLIPTGEKMRAWVVYEENLSWDQAEADNVVALSYGSDELTTTEAAYIGEDGDEDEDVLDDDPSVMQNQKENATVSTSTSQDIRTLSTNDTLCPREPTPFLLSLLDQKTTFHLLKYFTQWIQGHFDRSFLPPPPPPLPFPLANQEKRSYNLTPSHARWIFALLSHLDAQLSSDEISVLRKLAREIIRLVGERQLQSEQLQSSATLLIGETSCWMIIAAITGVWGQQDLWIDAADALR